MADPGRLPRPATAIAQGPSWRIETRRPAPDLARGLVRLDAYAERLAAPLRRRELPIGQATLVFNLAADLAVSLPGEPARTFRAGGAFFAGPGTRTAVTEARDRHEGVQAMLTPLGARLLLGRPLAGIGDRPIDPEELFGREARDLRDRLQEAPDAGRRLDVLERALVRRLRAAPPVPADLAWTLAALERAMGGRSVEGLAEAVGCSRRHLSRRFSEQFGMPPKRYARLLRFAAALAHLRAGRAPGLAALALACGYADQAHLTREFAAFAGDPPAAFARRRLDDAPGFAD